MSETRINGILTAILMVGLGVRLAHFWSIADTAFPRIPLVSDQTDMYAFWQWAQTILAGDWLGRDTYHPYFKWMGEMAPLEDWYLSWGGKEVYHQAPLYPYFLAIVLSLANTPAFAFLVQLIVGALHPLIMFFLARRLFDSRVALVAAALTALYGPFVFYETTLLRDWLPPILEPLILLLVLRAQERQQTVDWLTTGAAIGLGILTKETTLAVSAMALFWLILQTRHTLRDLARPMALLGAGLLICLAPLFARNISVGAPLFAVSGQGRGNVLIGLVADMPPVGFFPLSDRALEISERAGTGVWSIVVEALRAHEGNVGELLVHQLAKIRGIIDPFEVWNNTNYYYGLDISPALVLTVGYGVVFPLGIAGVLVLLPSWRRVGLFYCYLWASAVVQMITIVLARFRLALVPVLILGAAYFLVRLVETVPSRQIGRGAIFILLVLSISLFQHAFAPFKEGRSYIRPAEPVWASKVYLQDKRFDLAVMELARLRDEMMKPPTVSLLEGHYRLRWAEELIRTGNRAAARRQVQLAEKHYAQTDDTAAQTSYNLGVMYNRLGDRERATGFFQEYLNRSPEGPTADRIRALLAR